MSVIIPTYNRRKAVVAAIESALIQGPDVGEVLVCDDGSTDGTEDAIKEMSARDPRVKWCPSPSGNSGRPAVPRNRGIALASYEWLAFLDSDDLWLPGKIASQLEFARRTSASAVASEAVVQGTGSSGAPISTFSRTWITFEELLPCNFVPCLTVIAKKSVVRSCGGFPETSRLTVGEDFALWLKIASLGGFAWLPKVVALYCDNPSESVRREKERTELSMVRAVCADFLRWRSSSIREVEVRAIVKRLLREVLDDAVLRARRRIRRGAAAFRRS